MSDDPYAVLGIKKTATADEIRKAYRALAKKLHPDLNPGDRQAEERFKNVSAAYDLLSDPEKRARFDRGEIDASGAERAPQGSYRHYAESGQGARYSAGGGAGDGGFGDFGDIFSDLFRRGGRGGSFKMRGGDVRYELTVEFLDAAKGAKPRLTMPDGKTLDVTIPAGLRDGQTLRLKGQGLPGIGGAEAGDAYVEVHVRPHKQFTRVGDDIEIELPISLSEAVLGGKVTVPTIDGPVAMTVPKGSNTGRTLRLKGKGVPVRGGARGDQRVRLKIVLPDEPDPELERLVREWSEKHPYDPRAGAEG